MSRAGGIKHEGRPCDRCQELFTPKKANARFCAPCRRLRKLESQKRWNARPENKAIKQRLHREKRYARTHELAKYGLTIGTFEKMVTQRDSRCDICEQLRELCLDHDHATGAVRGLLCRSCNRALGLLGDTADSVHRALIYLEEQTDAP